MSYRTILVHLNDSRRAGRLIAHSVELARAFEARLVGLHVSPGPHLRRPIAPPIAGEVLESLRRSIDEEAQHIQSTFKEMTERERFVAQWRFIPSERTGPARVVMKRARAADLVVASQTDPKWELSPLLDFPDRLAVESGRPVLLVPNDHAVVALPRRVVIAWNGSREASRALFDALPLLKGARSVQLLAIDDGDHLPEAVFVAEALHDHGITATILEVKAGARAIGELICAQAAHREADLLVMGAYGHSRLSELVFGGATRHALKNMTVPVLFSH